MALIGLTIFKALICLAGFGFSAFFFFPGFRKRDKIKMKKGGLFFLLTWVMIILITVIEFIVIGYI